MCLISVGPSVGLYMFAFNSFLLEVDAQFSRRDHAALSIEPLEDTRVVAAFAVWQWPKMQPKCDKQSHIPKLHFPIAARPGGYRNPHHTYGV